MGKILTLTSLGRKLEALRYEKALNKLIEEGEVWELNNLLNSINKEIDKFKES